MNIRSLTIGCALLGLGFLSSPASATPSVVDLGALSPPGTNFSATVHGNGGTLISPGAQFADYWKFSLSGDPQYASVYLSGTVGASLNPITGGSLALYECSGACGATPTGTLVEAAVPLTNTDNNNIHGHLISITQAAYIGNDTQYGDLLSAGNYFFELTGYYNNRVNATTDAMTGSVTITAVPEVSTWLMMLAGFAGLGFVGYRRSGRGALPYLAA